ncbi:hypothetical protein BOX15_Mlig019693g3, partial [Macrostomum lignano]
SAMSTAKLPLGGANPHVKASRGGDANLMKFYCTTSASTHGSHFANFQPRPGRHTGTGYQANIRPTVQYSGRLDQVDNPAIGRIVAGNYRTVFQRDFNPYSTPTGSEPLPLTAHKVPTGFVRDAMLMPMQRRRQGPPQPLTRAATVAGPSEYRDKYSGRQLAPVDLARSDVGPKERSGFTNNVKLNEPVRHTEHSPHRNEKPGWMTHRPTGVSIYTTGYRSLEVPDGREPLPHLADRGSRDSGFSAGTVLLPPFAHRNMADAYSKLGDLPEARLRQISKSDPAEFVNVQQPNNHSTVYQNMYQGKQYPDQTYADRIGTTAVGDKEPTGHVTNDDGYVQKRDSAARFLTNYTTQFLDTTPVGKDREGHTAFGVLPAQDDGFTKSTKTHFSKDFRPAQLLRSMDPYQARSVVARDRFYDDHTYDRKVQQSACMCSGGGL